jgi:hypothetical protein
MSDGTTPAPAPQPEQAKAQIDALSAQLMKHLSQPRSNIQPSPGAEQPKPQGQQGQGPQAGQRFVHSIFGLIYQGVQNQKQQQLRQATGVLSQLNNSWQKAQDLAQGDQQKANQIFSQLPEVTHILEDKKNVKQLGKLLQFDFMNPEKGKTVWHEALGKVVEAGKHLGFVKAIQGMMGEHKKSQQQQPQDYAAKEQEASGLASKIASNAMPAQPQLSVMQELKAMNDSIKNERENLKAEQANLNKQRELGLKEEEFTQKKKEFDQKEKDFDRRQTALENYHKETIKNSKARLDQAGASQELRRIVTGLNYAPQLLKPGEAQAFGMQVDEDGNLIPAKSPMSATNQERNASQQAKVMDSLIDTTLKVLDDPDLQNKLGPFQGRLSEIIQGKVGANVPEFDTLRTLGSFDASGMLKLHFGQRGGQAMYDKIHSMLDTGKMDLASLRESLKAFKTVAGTYKKQVTTVRDKPNAPKSNEGEVVIDLTKPH